MGTAVPIPSDKDQVEVSTDPSDPNVRARMAGGPLEIHLPPGFEDNPGLPPEVWPEPPAGYELPK